MKWLSHLMTVNHHRLLVMRHCFKVGLYRQGLLHDLSKYAPAEFLVGAKYYQGTCSPNEAQRRATGCSTAWLRHKGRNKHHLEYWIDYDPEPPYLLTGTEMPVNYVVEMFCDRVAASKTYNGERYQQGDPYAYYQRGKHHYLLHPRTQELLEQMLGMLRDRGEEATFAYIRREILGKKERRVRRFLHFIR